MMLELFPILALVRVPGSVFSALDCKLDQLNRSNCAAWPCLGGRYWSRLARYARPHL